MIPCEAAKNVIPHILNFCSFLECKYTKVIEILCFQFSLFEIKQIVIVLETVKFFCWLSKWFSAYEPISFSLILFSIGTMNKLRN